MRIQGYEFAPDTPLNGTFRNKNAHARCGENGARVSIRNNSTQIAQGYYPPQFCAKKVEGIASYKNARNGIKTDLKKITSSVYDIEMLSYNHPFISFKATVSEGSYIRSLGEIICKKLEIEGTLSSLKRINEGNFKFENEKSLNPLDFISLERNEYLKDIMDVELGKKLSLDDFKIKDSGVYLVVTNNFFSIIEIKDGNVAYKINRMPLFKG